MYNQIRTRSSHSLPQQREQQCFVAHLFTQQTAQLNYIFLSLEMVLKSLAANLSSDRSLTCSSVAGRRTARFKNQARITVPFLKIPFHASASGLVRAMSRLKNRSPSDGLGAQMIAPATFEQWMVPNNETQLPESGLSAETALIFDIVDYTLYLEDGACYPAYLARFRAQVEEIRRAERVFFDFRIPENDEHNEDNEKDNDNSRDDIPSFKEWTRRTRQRAMAWNDAETSGHERHTTAVAAYAEVLRPFPEYLKVFMELREKVALMQRQELYEDTRGTLLAQADVANCKGDIAPQKETAPQTSQSI